MSTMKAQEPVAWRVYFPDDQRQEYCDNLDELIDDLTNCRHDEPEPLYTHPPAMTRYDELFAAYNEACVDVARLQVSNEHLAAGLAAADEEVARLRKELAHIINAKRFNLNFFDDDTAFADWVQNRARAALEPKP